MIYSHSRINTFKLCPKQFEYKYIKGIVPIHSTVQLALGKLVHKGIELKSSSSLSDYVDDLNLPLTEKAETVVGLAMAMVDAYFERFGYHEIVFPEQHFEIKLGDYLFQGFIDGIEETDEGYYIHEYKTASRIDKDYIDKLKLNEQISRYYYVVQNNLLENLTLDKPLLGVKYRIIQKPQIRQKQNESITQFRNRLVEKIGEEGYIQEIIFTRTQEEIDNCILDTIADIERIENTTRFTHNLVGCSAFGRCPYLDLCIGEPDADKLYIKIEDREENDNEGIDI